MSKPVKIGAAVVGALAVVLIAGQLFLPGIVAANLKSGLTPYASDVHVSVQASPAIKLLAGEADNLQASAATMHAHGQVNIPELLRRTKATTNADVTVGQLYTPQGIEMTDVALHKRGSVVRLSAGISRQEIQAALPHGITLGAATGNALAVTASINLLGHQLTESGELEARNGGLVLVPNSPLIPPIKLFADPRVSIDTLHMVSSGADYEFAATAHFP